MGRTNYRESCLNDHVVIEHEGRQMRIPELARATGLSYQTIYWRWNNGLRGADLVAPAQPRAGRARRMREKHSRSSLT